MSTQDVTARLGMYRECVRHLWNLHFLDPVASAPERRKWELRDEFEDACVILFGALVATPLGAAPIESGRDVLSPSYEAEPRLLRWLRVVPSAAVAAPILINRDPTSDHGYWDHPVQSVTAADVDLRMVRLFDFDQLSFRDFRYFLVRISSAAQSDLVGRAALIECQHARVLLDIGEFDKAAAPG